MCRLVTPYKVIIIEAAPMEVQAIDCHIYYLLLSYIKIIHFLHSLFKRDKLQINVSVFQSVSYFKVDNLLNSSNIFLHSSMIFSR